MGFGLLVFGCAEVGEEDLDMLLADLEAEIDLLKGERDSLGENLNGTIEEGIRNSPTIVKLQTYVSTI